MPIEDNVGKSEYTARKQFEFDSIIRKHIAITQSVMKVWDKKGWQYVPEYLYIDATAGPGVYQYNGHIITGSPLIFVKAIRDFKLKYRASCFEVKQDNYETLLQNINGDIHRNVDVYHGNYEKLLPVVHRFPRSKQFGLLYIDPNSGIPDVQTIKYVIDKYPLLEILIRYSATNLKRAFYDGRLSEVIDELIALGKPNWLVGGPTRKDRHQWSFLLGTKADVFTENKFESINLHPKDSDAARRYFDRLDLTSDAYAAKLQPELPLMHDFGRSAYQSYDEYLKHPIYQEQLRRIKDRANGTCEVCHAKPVTEVHHYKYPEWGTFELDDKYLVAVCHDCHCKLEGKDK